MRLGTILVLGVIFFLIFNSTLLGKEIKNFFYLLSSPLQRTFWRAGERVSNFLDMISEMENLKRENEELQLQVEELLAENVVLREFKKENEVLREALKIGLEKDFELTLGQVIGKDIAQDSLLIDKGSRHGIQEGFLVITQQRVLVGKIGQVYKNFSKVFLISHPKTLFSGKIIGTEIFGQVQGKGNLKVLFTLVPKEKEIKEEEIVISSALGGILPQGLLVGKVKKVRKSDLKPFQSAEIEPFFRIDSLERIFIIEWRSLWKSEGGIH